MEPTEDKVKSGGDDEESADLNLEKEERIFCDEIFSGVHIPKPFRNNWQNCPARSINPETVVVHG